MLLLTWCYINVRLLYTSDVFFSEGTVKNIQHVEVPIRVHVRRVTCIRTQFPSRLQGVCSYSRLSSFCWTERPKFVSPCVQGSLLSNTSPSVRGSNCCSISSWSASGYRHHTVFTHVRPIRRENSGLPFYACYHGRLDRILFLCFFLFCSSSYCKRSVYTSTGIHAHAHEHNVY